MILRPFTGRLLNNGHHSTSGGLQLRFRYRRDVIRSPVAGISVTTMPRSAISSTSRIPEASDVSDVPSELRARRPRTATLVGVSRAGHFGLLTSPLIHAEEVRPAHSTVNSDDGIIRIGARVVWLRPFETVPCYGKPDGRALHTL